ncbi:kelch repeat-containing protein [Actinomadura sp. 9N215]|uniref:Kelch repeat-containing protein n=1 Tax=Actinomadura sp. 9N215 TaxID=3375150 RepID=UPI0037A00DFB
MTRSDPFTGGSSTLAMLPAPDVPQGAVPVAAVGSWTAAKDMPTAGYWALPGDGATLLDDKTVLVAGGEDGARNAKNDCALFKPGPGEWETTGSLTISRRLHTQTRLANGQVLVVGGITGPFSQPLAPVAAAEIYDPGSRSWTATGALHQARFSHSATLLPNGTVLVAGGIAPRDTQSITALASAEIFDPQTGEWTEIAPMHDARGGHPAVPLRNGKVLMVGGMTAIGRALFSGQAFCEIFDPAVDPTVSPWTPTGSMATVRKSHQATLLADGTVLVTGGDSQGLRQDWTYSPYSQWTTERFNPGTGVWAPAENMPTGRSHHRAVAMKSGKLLVIGGTDESTFDVGYQNAAVYDPGARTWSDTGGMVTGRWAFAAVGLDDGRVLAAGGMTRSGAAVPDSADVVTATSEIFTA